MTQKLFFISLIIISSSRLIAQKEEDFKKIDLKCLKTNTILDTNCIYTLCDDIKLDFRFSFNPSWVGALDDNFTMNLKRSLRVKINKLDSSKISSFLVFLFQGKIEGIKIENPIVTIYSCENEKFIKSKIKGKKINFLKDSTSISINLINLLIKDTSIIDIKYEILNLPKVNFKWVLYNNNYVVKRQFSANIPEIYNYIIEYNIQNNLLKDNSVKESNGIIIGYGTRGNLMSEAFYKYVQKRQPGFQATEVDCKYYINKYTFENLTPNKNSLTDDWIQLKLININPIK